MRTPRIDPVLATDRYREALRSLASQTVAALSKLDSSNLKDNYDERRQKLIEAFNSVNAMYRELLREIGQLR